MQAIKYKWDLAQREPFLLLSGASAMPLIGRDVDLEVGARSCIGHFRDGRHVECPDHRPVEGEWHCNRCRVEDDFFLCVKCDGSACANSRQRSSCMKSGYNVYLAAFDSLLKVGISHDTRLLERLVEQGADFGAKIAHVRDGKSVRVIEQEISRSLGITDRVAGQEKQKRIFCNPNSSVSVITRAVKKLQSNGVAKHLSPVEIFDLRGYYRLGEVPFAPAGLSVKEGSRIKGRVVAAKGAILVLRNGGGCVSVNAHELIGRELACN